MKKRNKIISAVLMLALVVTMALSGCGDKEAVTEYTAENPLTIKISHPDSESNVHQTSFEEFKEYVEKESNGAIKVEIYANGVLGGDQEVMQMVATNEVQIAECGTSVFATLNDRYSILDFPFLFSSYEDMDEAVRGDLGKQYNEWLQEDGYYCLGLMWDGYKTISNNKRPIKTLADMKGLKIRITDAELYKETENALGANPTPMAWGDIYTGLQQGTVDGMDVPALSTYSNGWHEALKYWSTVNISGSNCAIYTSTAFLEGLSEDFQTLIKEAGVKYLQNGDRDRARAAELDSIEKMKKAGVQVDDVTNIEEFKNAVKPVYDTFREKLGDETMDMVEGYRK
ncbi:TRAP transporter substrate-binding protein [Anaerovorax odorimutans]|uniref:TRAP transporter substrate-binding protein n=1 Tax=Anaerovorax odorimutans TaxID=109327 RepID=A0ABT1RP73_9FIRM|nr:TRAP transporter substrate-binding protein [Anaerovorax odorimutans]MCQ4636968.1 TRAP transporter substrate-binding protein [Anaerovorax odorimutans]